MFLPTIHRCSFQSQPHVVCQLKNRGYEASDIKDDGSEEKLKTPANHLARVLTNLMSVMIVSSRSFSLHFFCPVPRQSRGHVFICVGGKEGGTTVVVTPPSVNPYKLQVSGVFIHTLLKVRKKCALDIS